MRRGMNLIELLLAMSLLVASCVASIEAWKRFGVWGYVGGFPVCMAIGLLLPEAANRLIRRKHRASHSNSNPE